MKKILFPTIIFVALFFTTQSFATNPVLITKTIDGHDFDLQKNHGKVTLVNFWAYWCGHCKVEMLVLDEIYREYKSQGLEVIGINIDHKKNLRKTKKIASLVSYQNSLFSDAIKISFKKPSAVPITYVIDKNGKIVKEIRGSAEKSDIVALFKSLNI